MAERSYQSGIFGNARPRGVEVGTSRRLDNSIESGDRAQAGQERSTTPATVSGGPPFSAISL
jgi:hypothetical protein